MKNIFKGIAIVAAVIIAIDIFGFVTWIASGQTPVDGYYIGSLTASALRSLIF